MEKSKIYKPLLATLLVCGLSYDVLAEEDTLREEAELAEENTLREEVELVAESTPKQESTDELRKAAQNPVASMISVPFQNNTDFNIGPDDKTKNTMNIQPVIPFELNDDWNLITRTIFPVVSQPALFPGQDRTFASSAKSVGHWRRG